MSDANRSQLSFVEESTWGTSPTTQNLKKIDFTDETINFSIENIASRSIRSDRQTTDLIQTGSEAGGGFSFELQYGAFDALLGGALWGAWVGVGSGSTETLTSGATGSNLEFSLNATNNTITLGSSVTHAITSGQWIELTGSTGDDGYHFVTNVTGQVLTVASITTTETLDETDAATIKGAKLQNGTTERSFTIEKYLADKDKYFTYDGMIVTSFNIVAAAASICTGNLAFLGQGAASGATSLMAGYDAAATTDKMNAVANVGQIMEGSTLTTLSGVYIQNLDFTVNNNVRGLKAIGVVGNADIGVGKFDVSGTLNTYFEDTSLYAKYIAGTESGLSFKVEDSAGNAYIFTWPRIKFSSDNINVTGENTDIVENMGWQALRHATYGYTMQVVRIAA